MEGSTIENEINCLCWCCDRKGEEEAAEAMEQLGEEVLENLHRANAKVGEQLVAAVDQTTEKWLKEEWRDLSKSTGGQKQAD